MRLLWIILLISNLRGNPLEGVFSFDDSYAGTSVLNMLNSPVDARSLALGGNAGAITRDPTVLHWNPAGLSSLKMVHGVGTQQFISDYLTYRYGGISTPSPGFGVLGLSVKGWFTGDFKGRSITEDPVNTRYTELAATLGWGGNVFENISLGGSVSWLQSRLDTEIGNGWSLDMGAVFKLIWKMEYSLSLHNLSSGFSYGRVNEKLPTTLRLSLGRNFHTDTWTWQLGYEKNNNGGQFISAGGEKVWGELFATRLGYRFDPSDHELDVLGGVSAGAGIHWGRYALDYGFRSLAELGNYHTISFGVLIGVDNSEKELTFQEKAEKFFKEGDCERATDYAHKAVKLDPGDVKSVVVIQQCKKIEELKDGQWVTLLITANTSGNLSAVRQGERLIGGVAKRKTLVEQERIVGDIILLDAGRLIENPRKREVNERIFEAYKLLNYDLVGVGFNELQYLKENPDMAKKLPLINTFGESVGALGENSGFSRDWSKTVGEKELRFFSYGPGADGVFHASQSGIHFAGLQRQWSQRPDAVIIMMDASLAQAEQFLQQSGPVDLVILSGNQMETPTPLLIGGTRVICTGRGGAYVGRIRWKISGSAEKKGALNQNWRFELVPMDEKIKADENTQKWVEEQSMSGDELVHSEIVDPLKFEGVLFFRRLPGGKEDLFMWQAEKRKIVRLSRTPALSRSADLATTRNRMAVVNQEVTEGPGQLSLQNLGEKLPFVKSPQEYDVLKAKWGPFENWVYFIAMKKGETSGFYRISSAGTHFTRLGGKSFSSIVDFHLSPKARFVAVVRQEKGIQQLLHSAVKTSEGIEVYKSAYTISDVKYSQDEHYLAFLEKERGKTSGTLKIWDRRNDEITAEFRGRLVSDFRWAPGGEYLMLSDGVNALSTRAWDPFADREWVLLPESEKKVSEEDQIRPHRLGGQSGFLFRRHDAQGKCSIHWRARDGSRSQMIAPPGKPCRLPD